MKFSFRAKAKFIFLFLLSLGLLLLVGLVAIFVALLPDFKNVLNVLFKKVEMACGCSEHLSWAMHPYIFSGIVVVGIGFLMVALIFIFKAISLFFNTRKFVKDNLSQRKNVSIKLKKVSSELNLLERVIEINKQEPLVFCFGFWQPKICLSSGLVDNLSQEELEAIILHEAMHVKMGEPLKTMIVKILTHAFFFIPGFSALAKRYFTFAELSADENATYGFTKKESLARALYKMIKLKENLIIKRKLALSFFNHATEERVKKLTDNNYSPKFSSPFFISLGAVIIFVFLLIYAKGALGASIFSMKMDGGFCAMPPESQMSVKEGACTVPVYQKNYCSSVEADLLSVSCSK